MAIDFDAIEAAMATAISNGIASGINDQLSDQNVPASALSATYTWNGTTTVLSGDTSEVEVDDHIRLDSDGVWYKVASITPDVSVTVSNVYSGTIPTGATQSSKADLPPAPPIDSTTGDSFATPIAEAVRAALETAFDDAEISGVTAGAATIGPGVIS